MYGIKGKKGETGGKGVGGSIIAKGPGSNSRQPTGREGRANATATANQIALTITTDLCIATEPETYGKRRHSCNKQQAKRSEQCLGICSGGIGRAHGSHSSCSTLREPVRTAPHSEGLQRLCSGWIRDKFFRAEFDVSDGRFQPCILVCPRD